MLIIDNLIQSEIFKIFVLSMLPITELRFSIPYGINFYLINEVPVKRNKYGKHLWFS